jgi:transcriptional regulator with XRE-family HTH domain
MDDGAGGFGGRLRASRRSSGLTQQELAERSGLSVRAISKLECGQIRWPYPDSVGRLADALGLRDAQRADFTAAAGHRLGHDTGALRPRAGGFIPRLLPARRPGFVGRAGELKALSRMLDEPGPATLVTAITGTAGAGKTALAVHWAHQVAERFPDGQLFVNLRGFGPCETPLTPADAARMLLDALRVPADRLPETVEAQLGLYRSLVSGKSTFIVLDNARDAAQVRPLLPGSPTCRVLVTSRDQMPGLTAIEAARPLFADTLTSTQARELLATRLGTLRLAADQRATGQIIGSCAGLPLALCIIAARAELRPDLPLACIAEDLISQPGLDAFTGMADPAADLRAAFSWSYRQLDSDAARTFRLAGLHPGTELEPHATAALIGATPEFAGRILDALARASLITPVGQDRYTMNALLRAYAREQAVQYGEDGAARLSPPGPGTARRSPPWQFSPDAGRRSRIPAPLRLTRDWSRRRPRCGGDAPAMPASGKIRSGPSIGSGMGAHHEVTKEIDYSQDYARRDHFHGGRRMCRGLRTGRRGSHPHDCGLPIP